MWYRIVRAVSFVQTTYFLWYCVEKQTAANVPVIFTSDSRMLGVRTITDMYTWQLKSGMQFGVMEYPETVAAA